MKKPRAHVTDHAVLRWLERMHRIDVEAIRVELGHKVDAAIEAGAVASLADGLRYVLVGESLVSCVPLKSIPLRDGRSRRRQAREEAEE